ncbi:MAG: hypothetical protein J2P35_07180 [Actinobacteria bacterium]|nr:hypothetical protein [Actinomycetota bacterium]MBO0788471.1 hypothetical protein [Actinomycetota bacterium]
MTDGKNRAATLRQATGEDRAAFRPGAGEDGSAGQDQAASFRLNSGLLITGSVLAGLGSLLGLAGLALASAALAAATRRWVRQMEVPPGELARHQWARARAATSAGASAWRNDKP